MYSFKFYSIFQSYLRSVEVVFQKIFEIVLYIMFKLNASSHAVFVLKDASRADSVHASLQVYTICIKLQINYVIVYWKCLEQEEVQ